MSYEQKKIKYPRTPHVPFFSNVAFDDRVMSVDDFTQLLTQPIVITEKMDGENTTLYSFGLHARSLDYSYHASRTWVQNFHASFAHQIPPNWRICGENVYARHSIAYSQLSSYFLGFFIWNEKNEALSWQETLEWFSLLNITPVRTLYSGKLDVKHLTNLIDSLDIQQSEGLVIRTENKFAFADFSKNVCKWVRPNHVQTQQHWRQSEVISNQLKST